MGYRSSVAYTIRFTGDDDRLNTQTFYTFIAEAKSNDSCRAALEQCEIDENRLRINYYVEDYKWYDSDPHVQGHEELLELVNDTYKTFEDTQECIGYVFARIGENDDDTEWKAEGKCDVSWLWVRREMIKDW
jgi:hypothetical protein